MLLWSHWTNWSKTWVSQGELVDYQQQARSLEHVAAFSSTSFNLTGGGDPLRVRAAQVQPEIFAALGATADRRTRVHPDEDSGPRARRHADRRPVAIAVRIGSVDCRAHRFSSTPSRTPSSACCRRRCGCRSTTRAARSRRSGCRSRSGRTIRSERGNHGLNALGRLTPGVSLAQAQAEIDTITRGFQRNTPTTTTASSA